jgi:hypothetical protein
VAASGWFVGVTGFHEKWLSSFAELCLQIWQFFLGQN